MAESDIMPKALYAYIDESGNTGLNLFDAAQPYFWLAALISDCDVDGASAEAQKSILAKIGATELHAKEIGLVKIEQIADDIIDYIENRNINIFITRVEKPHIAELKFFDTIFDSDTNKAVTPVHYGIRIFRLILAHHVIFAFDDSDKKLFWDIYSTLDYEAFKKLITKIKEKVLLLPLAKREMQLIGDAFDWAFDHPDVVLDFEKSEMDSPNMIAFGWLINEINHVYPGGEYTIGKLLHDEQNQFAEFINKIFAIYREHRVPTDSLSLFCNMSIVNLFLCNVEFIKSEKSFGVQLVDIILWLTKKELEGKIDSKYVSCKKLIELIFSKTLPSDFSRSSLVKSVEHGIKLLYSKPLTPEMEKSGLKLMAENEMRRQQRMKE